MDRMKATELQLLTANPAAVTLGAGKTRHHICLSVQRTDLFNRISGRMSERA
jgi:hypothetical protein